MSEEPQLNIALERFRQLEEDRKAAHARYNALTNDIQALRPEISNLQASLEQMEKPPKGSKREREKLKEQIAAKREELERKQARAQEVGAERRRIHQLEEAAREFLESGGATVEELERGVRLGQESRTTEMTPATDRMGGKPSVAPNAGVSATNQLNNAQE